MAVVSRQKLQILFWSDLVRLTTNWNEREITTIYENEISSRKDQRRNDRARGQKVNQVVIE